MDFENLMKEIEQMSDEEKQSLLNTQFPEELEKQASAEVEGAVLADALYSLGWLQAERAVAEVDGLDKVASEAVEQHEQAENEVSETIENALEQLGTATEEDAVEFHKEAQAAAAIIFEGYSDCLEKLAGKGGKGMAAKIKGMAGAASAKMKEAYKGAKKSAKKHGKGAAAGAALGGVGAFAARKAMQKEGSDWTAAEIIEAASDVALEKAAAAAIVEDGFEKLAGKGAAKGKALSAKLKELYGKGKSMAKKHGPGAAAGAAGGGLAGYLLAGKKD